MNIDGDMTPYVLHIVSNVTPLLNSKSLAALLVLSLLSVVAIGDNVK